MNPTKSAATNACLLRSEIPATSRPGPGGQGSAQRMQPPRENAAWPPAPGHVGGRLGPAGPPGGARASRE